MGYHPIDLDEKFSMFEDQWRPKGIARMNDCAFKLAKVLGDFLWHAHEDTDEVFIVHKGSLRIDFRDASVTLQAGQMLVVPKGVEHKPFAEDLCELILVEREDTLNTGDAGSDRTIETIDWI